MRYQLSVWYGHYSKSEHTELFCLLLVCGLLGGSGLRVLTIARILARDGLLLSSMHFHTHQWPRVVKFTIALRNRANDVRCRLRTSVDTSERHECQRRSVQLQRERRTGMQGRVFGGRHVRRGGHQQR